MCTFDAPSFRAAVACAFAFPALFVSVEARAQVQRDAPVSSEATNQNGTVATHEAAAHETAKRLFEQGRTLMEEADFANACRKFEESLALEQGVGTQFNLASCYEKLGRKKQAHALFVEVAEATLQAGQELRHQAASERARALEAELGALTIEFTPSAASAGIQLFVGDVELPAQQPGERYFVEPGKHVLRANAPGKQSWQKTLSVGAGELLAVVVPELARRAPPAAEPVPDAVAATEAAVQDEQVDTGASSTWAWLPPAALGVGAVGLFVGIAYTQQYRASHEDAQAVCPSSQGCSEHEVALHDDLVEDERRARTRAAIGYTVAALGLGTALAYTLWGPKKPEASSWGASLSLAPAVGAKSAGGVVHGSF